MTGFYYNVQFKRNSWNVQRSFLSLISKSPDIKVYVYITLSGEFELVNDAQSIPIPLTLLHGKSYAIYDPSAKNFLREFGFKKFTRFGNFIHLFIIIPTWI